MLLDIAGPIPVVAGMHARVIVEAVFAFDYIARRPKVRAPLWVADSYRSKIAVIEEQMTFEAAGLDTRFARAQLDAFRTTAQRELQALKAGEPRCRASAGRRAGLRVRPTGRGQRSSRWRPLILFFSRCTRRCSGEEWAVP
jgi:hypothetical protein